MQIMQICAYKCVRVYVCVYCVGSCNCSFFGGNFVYMRFVLGYDTILITLELRVCTQSLLSFGTILFIPPSVCEPMYAFLCLVMFCSFLCNYYTK